MSIQVDAKLAGVVDAVAKELVTTEHFGSASIIKTPMLYPSGAAATVQITRNQDRYFVTDMGLGHLEAEMIGASLQYGNSAKQIAEQFGVRFDNQAFFVTEATGAQLPGAITIIANCSSEAAVLAAYKAAERKFEEDADILYQRLVAAFSKSEVDRDVEVAGSSTHAWPIAAMVTHHSRVVLFEPVNKFHVSVVNAAVKFNDISRLESPPTLIAMVKKRHELGNYLNVLTPTASVLEYDVTDEALIRVAEAA